jgi:hypothetical protein
MWEAIARNRGKVIWSIRSSYIRHAELRRLPLTWSPVRVVVVVFVIVISIVIVPATSCSSKIDRAA